MTTCWMTLDETSADAGTICDARGSHRWPPAPLGGSLHGPEDWLVHLRAHAPAAAEIDLVPIEVAAGGRRSVVSHMARADTRHSAADRHATYGRYQRPGEPELDEAFFPVRWRSDGYRTPFADAVLAGAGAAA